MVLFGGLAGGVLAEPVEPQEVSAPAMMAAGQSDWLWVVWLGSDGSGENRGRPTQIAARRIGQDWQRVLDKQLPRVQFLAARGDRLHVVLPNGVHYLYRPDGGGVPLEPLAAELQPISFAAGDNRLFAIVARTGAAASQPATMPARGPVHRSLHLMAQDSGPWKELASLPNDNDLLWADHLSLVVDRGRPVVLATVDGGLLEVEWAEEPSNSNCQVSRVEIGHKVGRLAEIKAVSINRSVCLVGWPDAAGASPFFARIGRAGPAPATLAVADYHDLLEVDPALELKTRFKQWDLAACGDRLIIVRADPDGGLQVRRYNPASAEFESEWQPVAGMGQSADWVTELFRVPAMFWASVFSVLVLVFMVRRPGGVIRLPIDVEPARLSSRALALVIDAVPCMMVAILALYGADLEAYRRDCQNLLANGQVNRATVAPWAICLGLLIVYQAVAESVFATTGGKRLFGLSVYSVRGVRPGVVLVLARNLLKIVDLLPFMWVVMLFHPARQRMGDMLSGTIVVGPRRRPLSGWGRQQSGSPGDDPSPPGESDDEPPDSPS